MTAILGYQASDAVYLAADRRVCSGPLIVSDHYSKIIPAGEWTFGVAGTASAVDCLHRASGDLATVREVRSLMTYLRAAFLQDGWQFDHASGGGPAGGKGSADFSMLLTDGYGLWQVFSTFAVAGVYPGYVASCGSGGELGQGAAAALTDGDIPLAEALRMAVRIAIRYDSASGGEPEVWRCTPEGAELVPPACRD